MEALGPFETVASVYKPEDHHVVMLFEIQSEGRDRRVECVAHRERNGTQTVFVGKPLKKIPHGRPLRTWEDIIKTDLTDESG
jgi:hypothetical protein